MNYQEFQGLEAPSFATTQYVPDSSGIAVSDRESESDRIKADEDRPCPLPIARRTGAALY